MDGQDTIPPALFRGACGRFATGVTIATAQDASGQRWGLTVNSFSSVSLNPPLVLFSLDRAAMSHDGIVGAGGFAINILSAGQRALSERFSVVRDADRFAGVPMLESLPNEPPLIAQCLCNIICTLEQGIPGGDHTILVGRVRRIALGVPEVPDPLLYFSGGYAELMRS